MTGAVEIYIATTLTNDEKYRKLRGYLREIGVGITFDWEASGGSMMGRPKKEWEQRAIQDMDGVRRAILTVVLLPGLKGTHSELGASLIIGCPTIVVSPEEFNDQDNGCIFYHHPNVIARLVATDMRTVAAYVGMSLGRDVPEEWTATDG